jgi:tRNA pseudouridine38-40 synthase
MEPSPAPRRIALLVEYDGTVFAGSQAQPGQRTVQDTLEAALEEFTGERQRMRFAGRTDAGVHARGQVATLDTSTAHSPATFRAALNRFLPPDVAVRKACAAPIDFEPRFAARSRVYAYAIEDGRPPSPLTRKVAWQLTARLDTELMAVAAALLPRERRDWAAFASPVDAQRSTLRTLLGCAVQRCSTHAITVTMEADAFLPHQVRRTVGALRDVGLGRITPEAFARLVDGPPGSVGPTAPPQGLILEVVRYAQGTVDWHDDEDIPPA